MNEFDKKNEQDAPKGNNRRSFLKKSATGAVVFSLPAKSVWGACSVSGAMSGNLSANTDRHSCTLPMLESGAKTFKWQDFDSNANDLFSFLASKVGDSDYAAYKVKYVEAVDLQKAVNLELPSELNAPSLTCAQALASGVTEYENLGAVFLNASFGLYPGYSGSMQAIQLVNDIFLYIYTNEAQGTPVSLNDGDYGFDVNHASSTLQLSL